VLDAIGFSADIEFQVLRSRSRQEQENACARSSSAARVKKDIPLSKQRRGEDTSPYLTP